MNSMTGFGAASAPWRDKILRVEISGVNRKQTEVAVSLPRTWTEFEHPLRRQIASAVSRGRVNVSVVMKRADGSVPAGELLLHEDMATQLKSHWERLSALGLPCAPVSVEDLMRTGVLEAQMEEASVAEDLAPVLEAAAAAALAAFLAMRAQEGEVLRLDVLKRLAGLRRLRESMLAQAAGVPARYRELLLKRLEEAEIPADLGDERILREIALFADRCDVSEELVRLVSHFGQFEALCAGSEPAGRPLDFLCQEMFREFNTIGSKANDAALAQAVVEAKTELEKIREQVQNIE